MKQAFNLLLNACGQALCMEKGLIHQRLTGHLPCPEVILKPIMPEDAMEHHFDMTAVFSGPADSSPRSAGGILLQDPTQRRINAI